MKDFTLYDIADFVLDEDFIRWVNENKPADADFWNKWLRRNPNKHLVVAEARKIVESIGSGCTPVPAPVIEAEVEKLLLAIRIPAESRSEGARVSSTFLRWRFAAAALVLVAVLGLASLLFKTEKPKPEKFTYQAVTSSRRLIENVNTTASTLVLQLPDGSSVKLAPNSRISYDNRFDSLLTRDIYLSGQAFFTVKKNPHHPFRVFANEIIAKVLGTSFTVRAFDKDTTIQVTVCTGKVSVYAQGEKATVKESAAPNKLSGIIVTPNQQVVYAKASQEFQKRLLEEPVMINTVSVNKSMLYEDAHLDKVFDDLGRDYGISIVYDPDILKRCTVTANLSNESFYHKLDLICRAIGAKYEVIDAQVVIQSNGCG